MSGIVSTIDPISQVAMRLNTGDQGSMIVRLHYPSGLEKQIDDVHYEVMGYVGVLEFTTVIPPSGVCVHARACGPAGLVPSRFPKWRRTPVAPFADPSVRLSVTATPYPLRLPFSHVSLSLASLRWLSLLPFLRHLSSVAPNAAGEGVANITLRFVDAEEAEELIIGTVSVLVASDAGSTVTVSMDAAASPTSGVDAVLAGSVSVKVHTTTVYGGNVPNQTVGLRWAVKQSPEGLTPSVVSDLIKAPILGDWSFDVKEFTTYVAVGVGLSEGLVSD